MDSKPRVDERRKPLRFMLFAFLLLSGSFIVFFGEPSEWEDDWSELDSGKER